MALGAQRRETLRIDHRAVPELALPGNYSVCSARMESMDAAR
jgi:hypothetical protein